MGDNLTESLVAVDLFRGLAATEIESLMTHATIETFAEGQPIFEAGAVERALYVLLEGTVEIELSVPFVKDVVLDRMDAVNVFGESSFFHAQPHSVTIRAVTETTVARLERAAYDQLLDSNHLAACRLGANAAEILAAKLQRTNNWIAELLQAEEAHRVQQKWWDFRQSMGHAFASPEGGGFSTGAGWR